MRALVPQYPTRNTLMYTEHMPDFVLVLKTGDEISEKLIEFLAKNNITSGVVSGIGTASDVTLNYYNAATKEYEEKNFTDEYEILSLIGNVSLKEDKPFAHLHIVLGTKDYACIGGHLKSAKVGATCEIVIQQLENELKREFDEATGLFLLT